jgi:hypothetical protein
MTQVYRLQRPVAAGSDERGRQEAARRTAGRPT